jgi:TRAP-type C4-dicarboxylate transport system substrate-binding protein
MKKSAFLLIMLTVAALVLCAGPETFSAQDQPIELTMRAASPKVGRYKCGFKPWADMVEKATGGKVKITFSFGRLRGDPYETLLRGAKHDINFLVYGFTKPNDFPLTKVFGLPGAGIGIKDPVMASHILWNLYKKFPEIQNEHKDFKVLYTYVMAPSYAATSTKPIRTLDDLKGMKIAGGPPSLMKELGVIVHPLNPATTTGSRMEKGEIEGAIFGIMGQRAFGVTKLAKYFTEWPGGPFFLLAMKKDKWDQLPPDVQEAIMSVSGDVGSRLISECDQKSNQKALYEVRAAGKEIISLSPEENSRLSGMCEPFCNEQIAALEAKGLPARAVYNEIRRMVKESPN